MKGVCMQHSNHNSKMMWLMMAGCLLLPMGLLIFGGRGGNLSWGWFTLIGAFILIHVLMIFGHNHGESASSDEAVQADEKSGGHNH